MKEGQVLIRSYYTQITFCESFFLVFALLLFEFTLVINSVVNAALMNIQLPHCYGYRHLRWALRSVLTRFSTLSGCFGGVLYHVIAQVIASLFPAVSQNLTQCHIKS